MGPVLPPRIRRRPVRARAAAVRGAGRRLRAVALAAQLVLAVLTTSTAAAAAIAPADPFAGRALYVDPSAEAGTQARAWKRTRPLDAALMERIGRQPQAFWVTGGRRSIDRLVAPYVAGASAAGAVPVLVAYGIPHRDCGQYSTGGAASAAAYRVWIRALAAAIGDRRAAVILEPDALAALDCLPARLQRERLALLADAVDVLGDGRRTAVYLDAGHAGWVRADAMARRLRAAGIARARGFSLNVSSFDATDVETAYGHDVSARVGAKPFVIDTSRNGAGPDPAGAWCNPEGRALGALPTARTGDPLVDAWLWVKHPGRSDGPCNGGPAAGRWWPAYALALARQAGW